MKVRKSLFFSLLLITIFCLGPIVYGIETFSGKYPPEVLEETHGQKGWSETTQSRQRKAGEDRRLRTLVENFVEALRKGDCKAFLYVTYRVLEGFDWQDWDYTYAASTGDWSDAIGVIPELERRAVRAGRSFVGELTKGNDPAVKARVVKATLSGLFNKDPRVRLVAVNWLRRLTPEPFMAHDVKRALAIETVTTERAKWREKDMDIPNIENPRLGANDYQKMGTGEIVSDRFDAQGIPIRHWDNEGTPDLRNGWTDYKAGLWLMVGQFGGLHVDEFKSPYTGQVERNDYKFDFTYRIYRRSDRRGQSRLVRETIPVWTKFSLLRYGADEQTSGWEEEVKIQDTKYLWDGTDTAGETGFCFQCVDYKSPEEIQKFRYLYIGYPGQFSTASTSMMGCDFGSDPCAPSATKAAASSADGASDIVMAYHSVWEEMKKLDLFITRDVFARKIKGGDIEVLRWISKDTFRTLADQIDGESVYHVPMKSLDLFAEPEVPAIIVGLLENKVISTREECARHLKRIFYDPRTSMRTKVEIKKALKEARRRALLTDVIRGRHYHWELVPHLDMFCFAGEEDQIDTSIDPFKDKKGKTNEDAFRYERKYLELPEESIIIYHDRRKPGKASAVEVDSIEVDADDNSADDDDEVEIASIDTEEKDFPGKDKKKKDKGTSFVGLPGHQLLAKTDAKGNLDNKVSVADMYKFYESLTPADKQDASDFSEVLLGEQNAGNKVGKDKERRSLDDPLNTTFYDFMNAVSKIYYDAEKKGVNVLDYMAARRQGVDKLDFQSEVENFVPEKADTKKKKKKPGRLGDREAEYQGRGRVATQELEEFDAKKKLSREYYYGHGRGGYWNYYDYDINTDFDRSQPLSQSMEKHPVYSCCNRKDVRKKLMDLWLPMIRHQNPEIRLFATHILRRLCPDKDMLKAVNCAIRELETVDKRRYRYIDTVHFDKEDGYEIGIDVILNEKPGKASKNVEKRVSETLYVYKKDVGKGLDKVITDGAKSVSTYEKKLKALIKKGLVATKFDKTRTYRDVKGKDRLVYESLKIKSAGVRKVAKKKKQVDATFWQISASKFKVYRVQEKTPQDELVKLQRFITRYELIKEIRRGRNLNLLKEVPKGHFLTLVVRIDAEWYQRIPYQTYRPWDLDKDFGFFRAQDIDVIKGGLENPNFVVQKETARWLVNFYNMNVKPRALKVKVAPGKDDMPGADKKKKKVAAPTGPEWANKLIGPDSDVAKKFLKAIRFAEAKDLVYFERNYRYKKAAATAKKKKTKIDVTFPNDRVVVVEGSPVDRDLFWKLDEDRYDEQVDVETVDKIYKKRRQRRQSASDEYYVRFP